MIYLLEDASILRWIKEIRKFKSTDPRDKLYSIMGIIQDLTSSEITSDFDPTQLIIDYSANPQDVFSSIVRAVVVATKDLQILKLCENRGPMVQRTWTPDLTANDHHLDFMSEVYLSDFRPGFRQYAVSSNTYFKASAKSNPTFRFAHDLSTFDVNGARWDRVEVVFEDLKGAPWIEMHIICFEMFQRMFNNLSKHRSHSARSQFRERLWQSIAKFVRSPADIWGSILDEWIGRWKNYNKESIADTPLDLDCDIVFSKAIEEALHPTDRFSITEKGYICRSRNKVKIGDWVCVLFGCNVPMILRPVGDRFELVGQVFCHGIMFGEAVQDVDCGKAQLETFVLQ